MSRLDPVRSFCTRVFLLVALACLALSSAVAQNVIIIMIDGARYTESLGAKETYMPHLWNDLRPNGVIYTNFRNEGKTLTCAGHTAVLTGIWQDVPNDGSVRPWEPTVFEMFRKNSGLPERACYVVSGKKKLDMLTCSTNEGFGQEYGATFVAGESTTDTATYRSLMTVLDRDHPRLTIVNLPSTDVNGHAKDWSAYTESIRGADLLIDSLWKKLSRDKFYAGTTTLFVTNDHGRHDLEHGDFQNHGDTCEGCRHIMLFAIGPDFPPGTVVTERRTQIDIAPTVGTILGFSVPRTEGVSLLPAKKGSSEK